jgi:hypothetical protein
MEPISHRGAPLLAPAIINGGAGCPLTPFANMRPLPIESLSASGLATAIKEVASNSSIKKAAESLKQGLVDHNGAASCANLLRRIMQRPWDRSVMEVAPRI